MAGPEDMLIFSSRLQNLFIVPVDLTIDAVKFIVSTITDTDTTINVHLYSFDMANTGGTNDGNLSIGWRLGATRVDIKPDGKR